MVEKIGKHFVRVCSDMNEWIDAVFCVLEGDQEKAAEILGREYDNFLEQESECYWDVLKDALDRAPILFFFYYIAAWDKKKRNDKVIEFKGDNGTSYLLKDGELYLKVGEYKPEDKDGSEEIYRAYYSQGNVYKNEYAYRHEPDAVCYVPELSDLTYTANDFLALCNGQKEFADDLFYEVDWQHPDSLKEDWFVNGEWGFCESCQKLVDLEGMSDKPCPLCGKEI